MGIKPSLEDNGKRILNAREVAAFAGYATEYPNCC